MVYTPEIIFLQFTICFYHIIWDDKVRWPITRSNLEINYFRMGLIDGFSQHHVETWAFFKAGDFVTVE
jgi:hypothetical protein